MNFMDKDCFLTVLCDTKWTNVYLQPNVIAFAYSPLTSTAHSVSKDDVLRRTCIPSTCSNTHPQHASINTQLCLLSPCSASPRAWTGAWQITSMFA